MPIPLRAAITVAVVGAQPAVFAYARFRFAKMFRFYLVRMFGPLAHPAVRRRQERVIVNIIAGTPPALSFEIGKSSLPAARAMSFPILVAFE